MGEVTYVQPPKIQAIETFYRGYRMRSRLEARWAVCFDALGLKYDYEPEGFEMTDGRRYLPDFYFPQVRTYAEVKPNYEDPAELNRQLFKCQEFIMAGMGEKILFLVGEPEFRPYLMMRLIRLPDGNESWTTNAILDIHYYAQIFTEQKRLFEDVLEPQFSKAEDFSMEYRKAVYKARGARFDHNESGIPEDFERALQAAIRREQWGGEL